MLNKKLIKLITNKKLCVASNININNLFKPSRSFFSTPNKEGKETVQFWIKNLKDDSVVEVNAEVGDSILEVAHKFKQDLEGACDQSLACSTCHVIFEESVFKKLGDACEEEDDLLDLAFELTPTSRLGCQIKVSELLAGTTVRIPSATRNMYVDGFVPEPH
jgi:ferredoxin